MNKGLYLIQRQQPEFINDFPTGNIFIGITKEELTELEKELKALEIIKKKRVDCGYLTYLIEIDEKNALRLYNQEVEINPYGYFDELLYDCRLTQEEYDLLKEVML